MWLLLLRGASVISVSADAFWSADGPDLHPIGWGNVVFRHFNPHRWTGPVAPRVTRALILRHGRLDCLESVEDYLLPRFIDGNPISKYVTFAVLIVELVWRHDIWYPCRL